MSPKKTPLKIDQTFTDKQRNAAEAEIVERNKRIEFYITEYSIEILAQKMKDNEFIVPDYQREDTWDDRRKARFLESVLMGLPIPFLFFWEDPKSGKLEIVDGSQRLRTLRQFLHDGFRLSELEELTTLNGFCFSDLLPSRQRKVKNRSIRGITLMESADERSRFELFDRINTGSMIANKAEIRRGALIGPFMNMVIDLSNDKLFSSLAPVSEKRLKLREHEELITRFFAYGDGLSGYKDRPSDFLFDYAKKMNARFSEDKLLEAQYRERFSRTMGFVEKAFPSGFRKNNKGKATPRARFEALAIGSYLALQENPSLKVSPAKVQEWLASKEFEGIVGSDSANAVAKLRERMHFVRDHLLGRA